MNKKEPTYENFSVWAAYAAVKNGEWTEDDFNIWASTVWNDGADSDRQMEELLEKESMLDS